MGDAFCLYRRISTERVAGAASGLVALRWRARNEDCTLAVDCTRAILSPAAAADVFPGAFYMRLRLRDPLDRLLVCFTQLAELARDVMLRCIDPSWSCGMDTRLMSLLPCPCFVHRLLQVCRAGWSKLRCNPHHMALTPAAAEVNCFIISCELTCLAWPGLGWAANRCRTAGHRRTSKAHT